MKTSQHIERDLAQEAWWRRVRPLGNRIAVGVLVTALLFGWVGCGVRQRSAGDAQGTTGGAAQPPASVTHTPVGSGRNVSNAPTLNDQMHPQATATMLPTEQPTPEDTATMQPTNKPTPRDTATSDDTSSEESAASDEQAVRQVVEEFGRQLRFVSVLAPPEVLGPTMERYYWPFVSPDLLERWVQDPLQAPGRQTSSPWPARIEISDLRRANEAEYLVTGAIVEVTGPDEMNSQVIRSIPIQLSVEKSQDRWLITEYSQEAGGFGAEAGGEL